MNQLLIGDNLPKRIATEPLSFTTATANSRVGIIAVGGVVALMLVVAIGLIVWLALGGSRATSQPQSDTQSNSPVATANTNSSTNQQPVIVQQNQNQAAPIIVATPAPSPATGAINGSASDSNGAAIPGTSVSATRVADGKGFRKVTNDSGRFSFADLPAGVYTVRFQAPGFSVVVYTNVKVGGAPARVNATLQVGSSAMTITHRGR